MNEKSSVLYGLEEKQKQLEAEVQNDLDQTLLKLEDEFNKHKEALIENKKQISSLETFKHIKNSLIKKKIEIKLKTNSKKLDLINSILDSVEYSFDKLPIELYGNFYRQSLSKLIQKYVGPEDSVIIHTFPEDIKFIDAKLDNFSIFDDLDPSNLGGYIIEIPTRKITINNTLVERAHNNRKILQKELAVLLFNSIPQPTWDEGRIISELVNI